MGVISQSESGLFLRSYLIVSLKFIDIFETIVDAMESSCVQCKYCKPPLSGSPSRGPCCSCIRLDSNGREI